MPVAIAFIMLLLNPTIKTHTDTHTHKRTNFCIYNSILILYNSPIYTLKRKYVVGSISKFVISKSLHEIPNLITRQSSLCRRSLSPRPIVICRAQLPANGYKPLHLKTLHWPLCFPTYRSLRVKTTN